MNDLPTFHMPACHRHFFKGYRWWCRRCSSVVEIAFRSVCEDWWAIRRAARSTAATPEGLADATAAGRRQPNREDDA